MPNLLEEEPISMHDAAKMFPRNARGKHRHISVLYRYTTRGVRGIVLESLQFGSKRGTTRQAVIRFITALTIQAGTTKAVPPTIDATLSHVDEELDRLGFGIGTATSDRKKKPSQKEC